MQNSKANDVPTRPPLDRAMTEPLMQLPSGHDVENMEDPFDDVPDEKAKPKKKKKNLTVNIDLATEMSKTSLADIDENSGDEAARGNWGSKMEFIFTCIGYAVGLGNVWRFPYLAYKNGGGAFLIPYIIMLGFVGLPLFFMELSFGQFASLGPIAIWKINPLFKGLGYAVVSVSWLIAVYYNVIISHVLLYIFASLASLGQPNLPWTTCDNSWNTRDCIRPVYHTDAVTNGTNMTFPINATQVNVTGLLSNLSDTVGEAVHRSLRNGTGKEQTPAEEYYNNFVLEISSGIDESGGINWKLALCLLLAWIIVLVCLIRGIQSLGKVVYFTAIFPYLMLTILLIRGLTLPGAWKGVLFYVKPDFSRLADARVWCDAATQIFYSLSVCCGGLICMSSYSKFNNNCLRDSLIVSLINCATSIFAGLVIFAVLGFMATEKGVEVQDVAAGGPGLAFVVYPEALSRMPVPQMWSILFFFMMATLGFGSQFSLVECVLSSFCDEFNTYLRSQWANILFRVAIILGSFLLGLPMVTGGGIYILNLVDYSVSGFPLLVLGFLECIVLNWIYGYGNFADDISMMLGRKPNLYWKACWMVITPGIIGCTLLFNCIYYKPPSMDGYLYPAWAEGLGWLIALFPIGLFVGFFAVEYCMRGGFKLLRSVSKPLPEWGPHTEEDRWGRYQPPVKEGTPLTPTRMKPTEYFAFAFYKPTVVGVPRHYTGRHRHLSTRSIGTAYEITRFQNRLGSTRSDL